MIFIMALLGAVTRLTESGLSITDWKPLLGTLPPLNHQDWEVMFNNYKQIPQYQILNSTMTLEEFKGIFFWEWFHRLWGRLIGLVFFLPLCFFWLRKKIDGKLALKLFGIFALGGLQGFIGWFMVQSGLEVRTSVSPYRLALHLDFALLVYSLVFWTALKLKYALAKPSKQNTDIYGVIGFCLLLITITWGAFVAGLHAGEAYNTWPLMDGEVIPSAGFTLLPKALNFFENLALVQFIHRWLGPFTMLFILSWVYRQMNVGKDRKLLIALGLMAILQVMLGLLTLLSHANIILASLHQAGAITLLTLYLLNLFKTKQPA